MRKTHKFFGVWLWLMIICLTGGKAMAGSSTVLSTGQTVYVPVYSHIYSGDRERMFLLAVTLSIRNVDPGSQITILEVNYHDTGGKLLKKYLTGSYILKTMASTRYVVKESDKSGGSGANFIVKWQSKHPVSPPIIESIMIGTQGQQGISFTSRGQVIRENED